NVIDGTGRPSDKEYGDTYSNVGSHSGEPIRHADSRNPGEDQPSGPQLVHQLRGGKRADDGAGPNGGFQKSVPGRSPVQRTEREKNEGRERHTGEKSRHRGQPHRRPERRASKDESSSLDNVRKEVEFNYWPRLLIVNDP